MRESNMSTPVYIPSYHRSDPKLCTSVALMYSLGFDKVILCPRVSQRKEYHANFPDTFILPIPDNVRGLGDTRQYLLQRMHHDRPVIMMDDDIRHFSYKKDPTQFGGLKRATTAHASSIIAGLLEWTDHQEIACACVTDRYLVSKPHKTKHVPFAFMRQFMVLKGNFIKAGITVNDTQFFSDISLTLNVLKAGIPCRIPMNLCVETPAMTITAAKGGCGVMREPLISKHGRANAQDKMWRKLSRIHKDVIDEWEDETGRLHHRIGWAKAYHLGLQEPPWK